MIAPSLTHSLADLWTRLHTLGWAVAVFRRPGDATVWLVASPRLTPGKPSLVAGRTGFAVAPFARGQEAYIAGDLVVRWPALDVSRPGTALQGDLQDLLAQPTTSVGPVLETTSDDAFLAAVGKAQRRMAEGFVQKVVLSRVVEAPLPKASPVQVFERLRFAYPAAFVALASLPSHGVWLGASPELLVGYEDRKRFRTMALAGTRPLPDSGDPNESSWSFKEIEEQAMVGRYIVDQFKKIRLREYHEEGPRAYAAGPVVHLRTDYEVDMAAVERPDLPDTMRDLLHPTSAVCGAPFDEALGFITDHEPHERHLYAGYWGPVLVESESHLFVNLRCLRWDADAVRLFVGAGITAASNPAAELAETEIKTRTLRRVLEEA
jgi:isochorismate synthase